MENATYKKFLKNLKSLSGILNTAEHNIPKEKRSVPVKVNGAVNLNAHPITDFEVTMPYGDIVLVICMLHDYIKMMDEIKGDDIQWQAYYKTRFTKMANRLASQIEYDYEAAVEKCKKKQGITENNSDVGEDGLTLALKRKRG